MGYKHNKSPFWVSRLLKKLPTSKIRKICENSSKPKLILGSFGLFLVIYSSLIFIQFVGLSDAKREIFKEKKHVSISLLLNTIHRNVWPRNITASNSSRVNLQQISATANTLGSPISGSSIEAKLINPTKNSNFIAELNQLHNAQSQHNQVDTLSRLKYAISLASDCRKFTDRYPEHVNHAKLMEFNKQIQNDKTLGALQSEKTIRNISSRMLAEYEHYQSFKDKKRWEQRSNELSKELSVALNLDWQTWLTNQKKDLEAYSYLLDNLMSSAE